MRYYLKLLRLNKVFEFQAHLFYAFHIISIFFTNVGTSFYRIEKEGPAAVDVKSSDFFVVFPNKKHPQDPASVSRLQ